jgi:hypothetical protein
MIPDLKRPKQLQYSPDYAAALTQLQQHSQSRFVDLENQMMAAGQRVAAINRRFQQEGDSVINLPLTFEAELFEFKEVVDLSYYARFRNVDQVDKEVTQTMNANAETSAATVGNDTQQILRLDEQMAACGMDEACLAKVKQQLDQVGYQMCLHAKQGIDATYPPHYKLWKTQWDDFRPASADLYAFTDPILKKVWVPALYDFLSLQRETMVYSLYTPLSGAAAGLVKAGDAYKDLTCVPPPPKQPETQAAPPDLPKEKPPECPLGNGIDLGLIVVKVHLGCNDASIEGGELLRFKASRNFAAHSTTLWAGVGAGGSVGFAGDMLGPVSPGASLSAQTGVGVTIGQNGTISDVFLSSEFSGEVSAGKLGSAGGTVSGVYSLENGAALSGNITSYIGAMGH